MERNKGKKDFDYHLTESKCPICGKNFIAAPYHGWIIKVTNKRRGTKVCSYSCMRKWEKEKLSKENTKTKS